MNRPKFRFVVVDDPEQLKDKQQMRENRTHVMHNYLDKKGAHPVDRDPRPRRRKTSQTSSASIQLSGISTIANGTPRPGFPSISPEPLAGDDSSEKDQAQESRFSSSSKVNGETRRAVRKVYHPPAQAQPLVAGIGGRFEHSAYMKTMLEDVPPGPGANLEPFGAWPTLISPMLDVNALKFSCSQRFGSNSLATHWIPALLRARPAFLSTLCISSAHDAVMMRALSPLHIQYQYKNIQRWRIKRDVISLVAECMNEPDTQAADETIVAVLHLLNSDIMGCDDRDMRIHQDGLIKMIRQRGGLEYLGVGGELAPVLTITNYLIAALREILPHGDYIRFASKQKTDIPSGTQPLPESPIYSRSTGFQNIQSAMSSGSETFVLLDLVRVMTNRFFVENEEAETHRTGHRCAAELSNYSQEDMASLYEMIFAFESCQDKDFVDMNERYTYESVRLAARIYAYALKNKMPFSKAAARLGTEESCINQRRDANKADQEKLLSIQLKHALMRTDISFCWDHLGGVLFWVTLIGGAAANPGPYASEERVGETEDARKFLAAIAVRCAIVLSFQYGYAVLETLKRLMSIEVALAGSSSRHNDDGAEIRTVPASEPVTSRADGPVEASHLQKGFADFALDFAAV